MNRLFRKTVTVLSAAVMSVCSTFGGFTTFAEGTAEEITVKFDFGMDTSAITPDYRTDGKLSSISDFASYTIPADSTVASIPMGVFECDTHTFSGWTVDNFYGYKSGETYRIPNDFEGDTIVFKAVWIDNNESRLTNIRYNIEYNGVQLERPEWLKDTKCIPGTIFEPDYTTIKIDNLTSSGLTDGERTYTFGTKIIIGDKDMVFTPLWRKDINVTYFAGDVDRLKGNDTVTFQKLEGGKDELAAKDRFSRNGFNLVGWSSSIDNKVYKPGETIVMPGEDVTFTAVWEAKNYVVLFITGNGGTSVKVSGLTDTDIICPDPDYTVDGKYFAGWKDSDGTIYQVGDNYTIKGAISGGGISLKGVWLDGDAPEIPVTTTATTAGTPVTTTTTVEAEPVVTTTINTGIMDFAPILEYETTPMKVGETRKVYVSNPAGAFYDCQITFVGTDSKISVKREEDSDIIEITALEAGNVTIAVSTLGCIVPSHIDLTIISVDTPEKVEVSILGDANCDGKVSIADATAILQAVGNPDKYGLTAQGNANADCCNTGDGVTAADALAIKKLDAKFIASLPEIIEAVKE